MLADTITTQLNNPECSLITGIYLGLMSGVKLLWFMFIAGFIYKLTSNIVVWEITRRYKKWSMGRSIKKAIEKRKKNANKPA